jgi:hypothetical protein
MPFNPERLMKDLAGGNDRPTPAQLVDQALTAKQSPGQPIRRRTEAAPSGDSTLRERQPFNPVTSSIERKARRAAALAKKNGRKKGQAKR